MRSREPRARRGFTLVEMMVALSVGTTVLILVLSSFRSLSTSLAATGHYRDMHHDVRHAMDIMQKDITRGSGVSQCFTTNLLAMTTLSGSSSSAAVVYHLTSNVLFRTEGSATNVLAVGVSGLSFTLYDVSGDATADPAAAYFVGVNMSMQTHGVRDTYADALQTRIRMRAKGL